MRETIIPRDETHWRQLRSQDVTSSDVAALFGLSPYLTEFELWHRHKDKSVVLFDSTERMAWGNRLEQAIAKGVAEDHKLEISPMKQYMRIPELRMGSSFDFSEGTDGILEVKNVDSLAFRDGWIVTEDGFEAPPHIELQIQHQLAVSGKSYLLIGALIGGNRSVVYRRNPNMNIISQIQDKVSAHWRSIENDQPPAPDFSRDAEFITSLYQNATDGKIFDATSNERIKELMSEYRSYKDDIKALDEKCDEAKAEILSMIGDCAKVIGDGFSISTSKTEATIVESFIRKEFRRFHPHFKKVQS